MLIESDILLKEIQLRSIHSRTRSQLVYECKHSILEIFGINRLDREDLAEKVQWLLSKDRFICREDGRTSEVIITLTCMICSNII